MHFIIKKYDKYWKWDRTHATTVFNVNDNWYAVMWVKIGNDGLPEIEEKIEEEVGRDQYFIYQSEEAALEFVRLVRRLN